MAVNWGIMGSPSQEQLNYVEMKSSPAYICDSIFHDSN